MDEYRKYEPIFGSWYLSRLIGKGSFGKVFEITREEYGTTYRAALKIISVPQDDDDLKSRLSEGSDLESVSEYYEGILRDIINENEIMAQLKGNSNIVSYEDHQIIPHEDGIGYDILIRMELLTPLLDRMMKKKLDEKEVVRLGIDMCKALELCHRKNIIHRDIKPQNIFISDNGDFKLGDFGIARTIEKTTGGMSKKGTYKYMAPEVFRGENYDATADIYSLGIVLFSMLNGNRGPFLPAPPAKVTHNDEEEARARRLRGEPIPDPKDGGAMLSMIIRKACAFYPQDRYASAEQMRADLETYLVNYGGGVNSEMTVSQFPAGAGYNTGSYNPVNTGSYSPVNSGSYNSVNTGSYSPVGRKTGNYSPVNTGSYDPVNTGSYAPVNTGAYPAAGGPREIPQNNQNDNKKKKYMIAAGALAVVLILAAAVTAILLHRGSGEDTATAGDTSIDPATVTVLSSDWDWDSSRYEDGLVVDAILLVRNDSDKAITGIDFTVDAEDGSNIENARDPEAGMTAYGYIPGGSTGIMTGEMYTVRNKIRPDNSTYQVQKVYSNDKIENYTVPTGYVTRTYGEGNDNYDVSIDNPNDVPVHASSKLVMAKVVDNNIEDSDATGVLSQPIEPQTSGYIQEMAFYDPHLYCGYSEVKVYAIDIDYYKNAE